MHVFISYHHNDLDFAENVVSRLEKEGFITWADSKLQAGEDWRTMIDLAIKNAFALIVIMTPEAKASEYVTYEWAFAWGVGIKVIPVMLKTTSLHPRLEALQYLNFSNLKTRPWERLIEEVKSAASSPLASSVRIPLNAPPFIRQAVIALDSAYSEERVSAIETLVQSKGSEVQGVLLEALKHPIADVRAAAAGALGKIGDASAVTALCEVLYDTNTATRGAVARALGEIGDVSAVPALCQALQKDDLDVREAAAKALGEIGDVSAVPALCQALRDKDACRAAAKALGEIGDVSAVPALYEALNAHKYDPHASRVHMIDATTKALGEIGDVSAVAVLYEALQDAIGPLRSAAARALGETGDVSAVSALCQALQDIDIAVRGAAARALGEIGDTSVVPALCQALQKDDLDVREAAAKALGEIGDVSAVPALRQLLNEHLNQTEVVNPLLINGLRFSRNDGNTMNYTVNEAIKKIEKQS